jgi:hypothetical protein
MMSFSNSGCSWGLHAKARHSLNTRGWHKRSAPLLGEWVAEKHAQRIHAIAERLVCTCGGLSFGHGEKISAKLVAQQRTVAHTAEV